MNRHHIADVLFVRFNYLFLTALGLATLYPFVNLLAMSLNDPLDLLKGGIYLWPRKWTLDNYAVILSSGGLLQSALMSVLRTVVGSFLGVMATVMLAYSLSRREFICRKSFNFILVFTMYVNGGLIPTYLLVKNLHLMNTFAVYVIPVLISAFNVIIVRSYFESLPEGIMESARIDGASDFRILFRIVLPISLPVVATITLFIAVMHWNSWFDNYLYTSRSDGLSLLQYELMKLLLQSAGKLANTHNSTANQAIRTNPQAIRAAMTMLATLPILFVYPFLQRYFVKGVTFAAMKE